MVMRYIIYAITKVSSSNQIEVPLYFSKHYGIVAGFNVVTFLTLRLIFFIHDLKEEIIAICINEVNVVDD